MKMLLFVFLFVSAAQAAIPKGHADLMAPGKKISGHVQVLPTEGGVRILAQVSGLRPGAAHGFHIHENGKCDGPDFESAGDHLSLGSQTHGAPTAKVRHIGDLGNLVANDKGIAVKEVVLKNLSEADTQKIMGKALILHESADDYATQPSGNAGARLACGVIKTDVTR